MTHGIRPACVLVGPPGSGKTTVGPLVASALGVEFRDTDTDVEAQAGKSISDIFAEDGEEEFRKRERAAVTAALSGFSGVLALGGGAVLSEATRAALRGHRVVYLQAQLAEILDRIGRDEGRPLLRIDPQAALRRLLETRAPLYEQVATITVVTGGRDPADIAAEIAAAIRPD